MNRTLEHILPRVQKPARYTGGEYNAVVKDRRAVDVRYALCFPDTYEIGMSNLGVRILYGLMNEMDGVWCERVFAPWGDMEEEMRREGIPLYGLESGDSIADFDLMASPWAMRWPIPMCSTCWIWLAFPCAAGSGQSCLPSWWRGGPAPLIQSPWPPLWICSSWGKGRT